MPRGSRLCPPEFLPGRRTPRKRFFLQRPASIVSFAVFSRIAMLPTTWLAPTPFAVTVECPWYMVGVNTVDVQHFHAAHDRRLLADLVVERPARFAHRSTGLFAVAGTSLSDRITRRFAGDKVTLEMTDWGGTLLFVRASFRRTKSYGMVARYTARSPSDVSPHRRFCAHNRGRWQRSLVRSAQCLDSAAVHQEVSATGYRSIVGNARQSVCHDRGRSIDCGIHRVACLVGRGGRAVCR